MFQFRLLTVISCIAVVALILASFRLESHLGFFLLSSVVSLFFVACTLKAMASTGQRRQILAGAALGFIAGLFVKNSLYFQVMVQSAFQSIAAEDTALGRFVMSLLSRRGIDEGPVIMMLIYLAEIINCIVLAAAGAILGSCIKVTTGSSNAEHPSKESPKPSKFGSARESAA